MTQYSRLFDLEIEVSCAKCGHVGKIRTCVDMSADELQDVIYNAVKLLREEHGITQLPAWAEAAGLQS